jgi:phosphatidylinositol-3,4,5-trisphosphate 5-phosphatase 2
MGVYLVLQLIKSRSNRVKLGIKLEGKGRRDFQFEDFKRRELFCQLVHQMRNMHSQSKEVDSISIFIGTWNMGWIHPLIKHPTTHLLSISGDAEPPHTFNSWLKCAGSGKPLDPILAGLPHDIYAFGTQESALHEKEWVTRLKNSLNILVGINFKQVAVQTLWGIRLVILVKEEHFNKISHVQQSTVKTGIAGVAGNKGGIGISFFFSGTSLCFVNTHLTSGNERCQRRNNNFYDILRGLQVGQASRKMGGIFDLTHQCHHVFWFGDLNYRIDLQIEEIFQHITDNDYDRLLDADQLRVEQAHGRAFSSFEEEEINFPPTYRYKRGTRLEYEYKKFKKTGVRINVPSYCDRILLSSFPGLQVNNSSYGCTNDIMTSDHSPVFATYTVGITTQFIPSSEQRNEKGTQIYVQSISAAIRTSSSTTFYIEIHSSCLESVVRSKRNSSFSSAASKQWFDLPIGGQENAHYTYPEWAANDFDQVIHPILPDQGYLQQQHLLIAVKSVEDDESYGECVVSLRELLTPNPNAFECKLTHRGMSTGLLSGHMHLPWDSKESTAVGVPSNYGQLVYTSCCVD